MPTKLATTVRKIDTLSNKENSELIKIFHEFMVSNGSSERHQNNNLKSLISFANFLGPDTKFRDVNAHQILSFLNSKIKNQEQDPDKKWITTWNDYLHRIKHFIRWLYNSDLNKSGGTIPMEEWSTPFFLKIKEKRTKRISPYLETELWEKEDLFTVIKYEPYKRNKAILSLLWDLNARPHELTLLKVKHIRLREKYGEGEIPHEAKTGTGPILLTISFPYVRDWLNEHPFKNESNARLICNLHNGSPVSPDNIDKIMKQLRQRIIRVLECHEINNLDERNRLEYLLKTKRWNPYCIRHSAITADSDYLPEYALKKKVRWSMNSKQGSRYIKRRMGNDLKQKILEYNGIIPTKDLEKKPSVLSCPRCELVNSIENKYCSKCSYPLVPSAFDDIKIEENRKFEKLEKKYEKMNSTLQAIFSVIQDIDEQGKRKLAVSLIESGLYSEAKA
jgi:site-specific recombinase XerD